jgi:hypothetical protein
VNVDLLPDNGNVNLGSAVKSWRNIYADSALFLKGQRFLSAGSGTGNTAVGVTSLNVNTSGFNNSSFGAGSLYSNTTGHLNVAMGTGTLNHSTAAICSVAIGDSALYHNGETSDYYNSNYNTAIGYAALFRIQQDISTQPTGSRHYIKILRNMQHCIWRQCIVFRYFGIFQCVNWRLCSLL